MTRSDFPRDVARRILRRAEQGEKAVVVVFKRGRPSRVFGLEEYRKQQQVPVKNQIWKRRRASGGGPNPLRAIEGRVLGSIRREDIYE
ncbi:MAG TPA: hypothetical protein VFI25_16390 [Planctomycetota bacterium]|jgi:hypothetical protein|nr:hypothetical protein [Planctomycetota bacterium]